MSFVNFLSYGTSHLSFAQLDPIKPLEQLGVAFNNDGPVQQNIAQETSTYESVNKNKFNVFGDSNNLFTVDCTALETVRQTWEGFKTKATLLRNGSAFFSAATLGALYWKHIPGNTLRTPFNLIMAVAASVLAGVALVAHYRRSQISPILAKLPSVNTLAQQICDFRNYLLKPASNPVADPLRMLNPNLQLRAFDFFTQAELVYLFSNIIIFDSHGKLTPMGLYYSSTSPIKFDTNSEEGRVIQAYNKFRKEIDFDTLKKQVEINYENWFKKTLSDQFDLKLENTPSDEDVHMMNLFMEHHKHRMEINYQPDSMQYPIAFEDVCKNIAGKLEMGNEQALQYLSTSASADFMNGIYEPCFKYHFNHVARDMNISLNKKGRKKIEAREWLYTQFSPQLQEPFKLWLWEALNIQYLPLEDD